jgi:hypothetical protein
MATIKYVTIEEFANFHKVTTTLVQEFADFGLIEIKQFERKDCLIASDLEKYESAIRLHRDLSINKEGIEIILDMREKHTEMQKELALLKHKIKKHEKRMSQLFSEEFPEF